MFLKEKPKEWQARYGKPFPDDQDHCKQWEQYLNSYANRPPVGSASDAR